MRPNPTFRRLSPLFLFLAVLGTASHLQANGIYGDGVGAQSMALGGADVAWAANPLGAMGTNPAGLGFLVAPEVDGGGLGGLLDGSFNKPGISSGNLDETPSGLPEGAVGVPLGTWPVVVGLSFVPESTLLANWHYNDPPGGLGGTTSYGSQQDKSELLELRTALGMAGRITPDLSFGASAGLIYNKNELVAPYIFQNLQPGPGGPANGGLDGAKTLLSLNTEGWGWNAQAGFIWRITPGLQVGASYESPTTITSSGDASGDPSLQFGAPQGSLDFHYDAKVTNTFPQQVRWGLSWKFQPQWRLATQIDWIDWSDAFHNLPLSFSNGSSAGVNAALGSSFTDSAPLNWKNEFVYRIGLEYEVTPSLTVRAGYCYGSDPVPNSTLTPLTAAIMEHTFTAGIGYHWDRYEVDLAYQYDIPATQNIGTSGLRSGEYSNSTIDVSAHIFALTTSIKF